MKKICVIPLTKKRFHTREKARSCNISISINWRNTRTIKNEFRRYSWWYINCKVKSLINIEINISWDLWKNLFHIFEIRLSLHILFSCIDLISTWICNLKDIIEIHFWLHKGETLFHNLFESIIYIV